MKSIKTKQTLHYSVPLSEFGSSLPFKFFSSELSCSFFFLFLSGAEFVMKYRSIIAEGWNFFIINCQCIQFLFLYLFIIQKQPRQLNLQTLFRVIVSLWLWDLPVGISQSVQWILTNSWNEEFCIALHIKCFGDWRTFRTKWAWSRAVLSSLMIPAVQWYYFCC